MLREHVSSTCATLGRLAQGSGGAAVTQTATVSPPGRKEMGGMDGASGIRIQRPLGLGYVSRKCESIMSCETFSPNWKMIHDTWLEGFLSKAFNGFVLKKLFFSERPRNVGLTVTVQTISGVLMVIAETQPTS